MALYPDPLIATVLPASAYPLEIVQAARFVRNTNNISKLDEQPWDLVIADYSMPSFSSPAALKLLKEKELDLPFIIVSGTIGEDRAVEAMKAGAHDFILKNNLKRLLPAIQRELREASGRRARLRVSPCDSMATSVCPAGRGGMTSSLCPLRFSSGKSAMKHFSRSAVLVRAISSLGVPVDST